MTPSKRGIKRMPHPYRAGYYQACAEYCVIDLQRALAHAVNAGAPYTAARIRAAISSARGAVRNAGYRATRASR